MFVENIAHLRLNLISTRLDDRGYDKLLCCYELKPCDKLRGLQYVRVPESSIPKKKLQSLLNLKISSLPKCKEIIFVNKNMGGNRGHQYLREVPHGKIIVLCQ